jgi:hypothetical protein
MRQRTIVCPLIQNEGHYLLCKMADDRGVFPGSGHFPAAALNRANVLKRRYVGKLVRSLARRCS